MRKAMGILLLLLANISILAHALVPHHHHDGIVVSICHVLSVHDVLNHDHSCTHHSHDSDNPNHGGGHDERCIMDELYARSGQNGHQYVSPDDTDASGFFFPLFPLASAGEADIKDGGNLPFRQKPYISSSYCRYIGHSYGLRAPPRC